MSTPDNGRRQARRIILAQSVVTALIAVAFAAVTGAADGVAALVGGAINVLANLYFARRLYGGARGGRRIKSAIEIMLGFYVGEAVKLFITLGLFALAIGVFKLSFVPLFTAFVATLLVFLLALAPGFNRIFGDRA